MDFAQQKEIQDLVQKEIQNYMVQKQFTYSKIPAHQHTGVDSPRIKQSDVVAGISASGSVTFSQITRYTLGLCFNPTFVSIEGIVVNSLTSPTIRCLTQGKAVIGPSYYMQPGTSTSTVIGGPQQNIIQSCSYLSVQGSTQHALTSEGHIVSIEYSGIHARATIVDFSSTELVIDVPYLDSGWAIVVNYLVM